MSQPKNKFIHLRVDEATHVKFTEACKPKSVTEVIRQFIETIINPKVEK